MLRLVQQVATLPTRTFSWKYSYSLLSLTRVVLLKVKAVLQCFPFVKLNIDILYIRMLTVGGQYLLATSFIWWKFFSLAARHFVLTFWQLLTTSHATWSFGHIPISPQVGLNLTSVIFHARRPFLLSPGSICKRQCKYLLPFCCHIIQQLLNCSSLVRSN